MSSSQISTPPPSVVGDDLSARIAEKLSQLPDRAGVYHMLDSARVVLYVGKAKSLKKRVRSYFRARGAGLSQRIKMMVAQINDIEWQITANEAEALVLENSHIKSLAPKFNILFRDDKSYPYLRFTDDVYSKVGSYRGKSRRGERCFGPYPNGQAVKETVVLMQKVFRLRTCSDSVFSHRKRPCLLHQIGRCSAPCVGKISEIDYRQSVAMAMKYVQGGRPEVFEELDNAMKKAAASMEYEKAAGIRDQLQALRVTASSQRIVGGSDDYCDLVACVVANHPTHGNWFGLSFRAIRAGEPMEEHTIASPNPQMAGAAEIISEYLRYRYAKGGDAIPKRIWMGVSEDMVNTMDAPTEPETEEADEWLKSLPIAKPRQTREKEWVERLLTQAKINMEVEQSTKARAESALTSLQDWLSLPTVPRRMECIDISHLGGEGTVASWVVFIDGKSAPADYRRYTVKTVSGGDDYGAIREIVGRRYAALMPKADGATINSEINSNINTEATTNLTDAPRLPDLLIIDGGVGQLHAALSVIQESTYEPLLSMPVVGLAKGVERIEGKERVITADGEELTSDLTDSGFRLMLAIRDEAHRFALTGQKAQRKKQNKSQLETLEGIGPTRRRRLIVRFGSMAGVREATIEQLQQVEGISEAMAKKIVEALQK